MTVQELLNTLSENANTPIQFSYADGRYLRPDYHLTEVKTQRVDSVDCGGSYTQWTDTIMQLHEPGGPLTATRSMTGAKVLAILNRVHQVKPMDLDSEVFFEYGNAEHHAAPHSVAGSSVIDGAIVFQILPGTTQCKAPEACGIPNQINATAQSCAPGSGCC